MSSSDISMHTIQHVCVVDLLWQINSIFPYIYLYKSIIVRWTKLNPLYYIIIFCQWSLYPDPAREKTNSFWIYIWERNKKYGRKEKIANSQHPNLLGRTILKGYFDMWHMSSSVIPLYIIYCIIWLSVWFRYNVHII